MVILNNISRRFNAVSIVYSCCLSVTSVCKTYLLRTLLLFSKKLQLLCVMALLLVAPPAIAQVAEVATAVNKQDKPCTMGVFPFISAQHLEEVFAPIAAELSEVMECSLSFRSASSFESFMNKLGNSEFDIAFIQPFDYVQIAWPQGYIPLVARNEELRAVIVTLKDSDVRDIMDLRGKTIALPPSVAAVSYIAMEMLEKAGLSVPEDVALMHSKNHGSCVHKVIIGKVDACVTALSPLRLLEAQHHQKLRIVAKSEALPNVLFVVRGDISDKKYRALQDKMLHLKLSNPLQKLFKSGEKNPFRITDDSEYDIVRRYCKKFRAILGVDNNVQCRMPDTLDRSDGPHG